MDDNFETLKKLAESMRDSTESILASVLTPEALNELTPHELNIIAEAKNALNFDGCTPSEKLNNLNILLRKNGL